MKNNILKLSCLVFVLLASSCSLFELDKNLDNPNDASIDALEVNTLMNKIQLDFSAFFNDANDPSMQLSRMTALTGGDVYERAYQPQSHNAIWFSAYQSVLVQIKTLLAETDGTGFTAHSGIARVLQAYTLLTLVDLFNDVPFSQALNGTQGASAFNPAPDNAKSVYDAALKSLDEAIALLASPPSVNITRDIYYGGDRAKWTALANTLKLKAYINLRLTDPSVKGKIEELLTKDLIDTDAEEFTYKYSNSNTPPRARHPLYRQMYRPLAGDADGYINNYYMQVCYKEKGVEDPRWRYYFYRQVGSIAKALSDEPESISCIFAPRPSHYPADMAWCSFDPGFFGRDHGNNDGLPPDSRAITCFGVYPAGGLSDKNDGNDDFQGLSRQGQGADGAGINPIWMASFTEFLKAEAALTLATAGDPRSLMLSGVNKSIERVRKFATDKGQSLPAGLEPDPAAYIAKVEERYDAASNDDQRLGVIMKEYYIALWGNGIETYNMYRRTGKPAGIQPMRAPNPGNFIRSLIYPADFVNLNSSATQKVIGGVNKVFWDNNPDNFIY